VDQLAKAGVTDLHRQVDVIRHPAVSVHSRVVAMQRTCYEIFEQVIVRRQFEDGLLVVPAEDDVIEASGNMHTWGSRHRTVPSGDEPDDPPLADERPLVKR
jgi:hypothetical protein